MGKRTWWWTYSLMLAVLAVPLMGVAPTPPSPLVAPAGAQRPTIQPEREVNKPAIIPTKLDRPMRVVIELEDAPATQVYAQNGGETVLRSATSAAVAQLARIETSQQRLLPELARLNATVLYRTQRVYNGIAVQADPATLAQIAQLPGVKALHPLASVKLQNSTSVPFIGAPQVWGGTAAAAGQGIKIGIIDTGIDYIHTDFGGSGAAADYSRNSTTAINESPALFPTAKVVGGYDFVGDAFDSISDDSAKNTPKPDSDPMDCGGHGSHVAGTAAGYGVNADGSTYTGAYNTSTNFPAFKIGPGVAPLAQLYALRIFGCEGSASSDVVTEAIEWAVDPNKDGNFSDHLDVINMSLGSSGGGNLDSQSVASNNAALAGVAVVASAGNDGDAYYIAGSPGNADRTLSVAASVDPGQTFLGMRVNSPAAAAGTYEAAAAGFGPALSSTGITQTVVYAQPANGCTAFTNGAAISGHFALIDRGTCAFTDKAKNAQNAGAVGVILVNNIAGDPIVAGGTDSTITIPTVMITLNDGAKIKAQLAANTPVEATLASNITVTRTDLADTLASFSSRGPGHNGSRLKPDIAAPGLNIVSVANGSGSNGVSFSGTSMAAPHMAGVMALLKQLHPTWTVEELKALAMNTALHDIRTAAASTAPTFGLGRIGAGRVDVPAAAAQNVIAYNGDGSGTVSVSFGSLEITGTTTLAKKVTIANKGTATATYNLAYQAVSSIPGVSYSVAPAQAVLLPGQSVSVNVTMQANPAQMKHSRDSSVAGVQNGNPRHWISEAAGYLTLTGTGASTPAARLPIYATARPAAQMHATSRALPVVNQAAVTGTVALSGTGLLGTSVPTDELSVVTAYELAYVSSQDTPTELGRNADLHYVGVSSDFGATKAISTTTLYFGLATYADWASPHQVEFDILIDTNNDGKDDYLLTESNLTSDSGGTVGDVFITVLIDLATGQEVGSSSFLNALPAAPLGADVPGLDTVPFNTNVMMLPVSAADLGLTGSASSFRYHVETYSTDRGDTEFQDDRVLYGPTVDQTPVLNYDAAQPGLDLANRQLLNVPGYADLPTTTIPFVYNRAAFNAANSRGLLLFHHHNTSGNRVDVVERTQLALPLISK